MEPIQEAALDDTLAHYLEEQALLCALAKAKSNHERGVVNQLILHRETLIAERAEHLKRVTIKRHARGEFYSDAKVKAINAMMPTKEELDRSVRDCFESQPDFAGVLKCHAIPHFGFGLISQRNLLACAPEDIVEDMRAMLALEEAFAAEWVKAIDDPVFQAELHQRQRETMAMLRTSKTGMYFVSEPACPFTDALDATVLGRAWNKLDSIAKALGVKPLSTFIGIDGQSTCDSAPAEDILPTVDALLAALQESQHKLPAKKATSRELTEIRDALLWLQPRNGRIYFEADL
jgi:hypothetical protein